MAWLQCLSTRLKLYGVTDVLDLDPIKRSLHLLKVLNNCKDYFQLRLLIRSLHNNYNTVTLVHRHQRLTSKRSSILMKQPNSKRSGKQNVRLVINMHNQHARLRCHLWTTIPPIVFFHPVVHLLLFSDPSPIPQCPFHCHPTVRI